MNTKAFVCAPFTIVLALAASAGCGGGGGGGPGATTPEGGPAGGPAGAKQAIATIESKSGSTMVGTATFTAEGDKVNLNIEVTGAPPGEHAVHLHEKGDCTAPDAMSAGDHWNPTNEAHGKWGQKPHHLGDIGNLKVGDDGRGSMSFTADRWTIGTGAMDDVVGRAVVIHAQPDDFATQPAGAAGTRVGCGVVKAR